MKRISRRNFLKAMGISATALTLPRAAALPAPPQQAPPVLPLPAQQQPGTQAGGTLRLCYGNPIATPGYTPRATGNALLSI